MIFKDVVTQKNDSQKLADISLNKDKSNQLWSELSETSEAAVSGGSHVEYPGLYFRTPQPRLNPWDLEPWSPPGT